MYSRLSHTGVYSAELISLLNDVIRVNLIQLFGEEHAAVSIYGAVTKRCCL